ncbi:LxmA leader domain family RiPP [Streptomyces sp. NRRL F-2580]|uniref:LxmA leader domain family RiPP n=1 Tax=Streptomyces sp. NRRL F-2580 TaxID=1463841 RepID=UPI000AB5D8F7|nr:LxmA leader domain family RiPP [Streptomyces sp. NRRL F-2580]
MTNDQSTLEDLVTGYESYADADEIEVDAVTGAPATTPFCGAVASFALSYVTTNGPG